MSYSETPDVAQRLALYIDRGRDEPVARQIVDRLWLEIITGSLETGQRLPTVRQLAIELGVRPQTVSQAYEELQLLGVLITRPGQGTFVGLTSPDRTALERRAQLERLCQDIVAQAEALGFSESEIIDALRNVRLPDRESHPSGGVE